MQQVSRDREPSRVVTFDLFSALTDARRGASAAFTALGAEHGWKVAGEEVYDVWDRHNKEQQRRAGADAPTTFRALSLEALHAAYDHLGLRGRPGADIDLLWRSVAQWPLWSDVEDGVSAVAAGASVGILSNVDDELVVTTRAHRLVDPRWVLTSEGLGAFKPSPEIYRRALRAAPGLVHVAASARDVRGALEAGIPTIRLVRPGHRIDPDGPAPTLEVDDARELPAALAQLDRRSR
ncbi:HAD family hydrolase [Pseudonocardia sp. KRD291]|uniref:HAD family hydrolase n=1 Tax=Pseudonocardia sp. KRD291 TaxID=2792007 RepID=UPI001C49F861|nr:HAD family hydrolase [Pseudonocardia sp. KRD291]MBW0102737.1 haloacid dehalogenase [Pseudonocardia sp. KRD291]